MCDAQNIGDLKVAAAKSVQAGIDWNKYPHLALVFKNRPPENAYWSELIELLVEMR